MVGEGFEGVVLSEVKGGVLSGIKVRVRSKVY